MPAIAARPATENKTMSESQKLRIMLVDDERITRMFIRDLIEGDDQLEVVAEASNGDHAVSLINDGVNNIDVVLLDLGYNIDGKSGLDAGPEIRKLLPKVGIIVLSQHDAYYGESRSWANGYLIKDQAPEKLVQVVRDLALHKREYISDEARTAASDKSGRMAAVGQLDKLSNIEKKVMVLTARGMSSDAVAREMGRSVYTINNHLVRIYNKLKIPPERRNKQELTRLATEARIDLP